MLETVNDARSGKGSFSYKDHATRRSVVSPDETLRINYRDHMLPPFAGSEPVDRAETLSTKSTARLEAIPLVCPCSRFERMSHVLRKTNAV